MFRCFIILIAFLAIKDYKLCNAAILPEEMPLAAFEEKDEETIIEVIQPKSIDTPLTRYKTPLSLSTGSVALDQLVSDKMIREYLAHGEIIKRAAKYSELIGCPPSVLIAQDALESRFGKSNLTKKTKNSGNIKCRCNNSRKLRKAHAKLELSGTPACIRGYDKIEGSNDYYEIMPTQWHGWQRKAKLLANYRVVKNVQGKKLSTADWCYVFHRSPYATDRRYDKKLLQTIKKYKLENIDNAVARGLTITSSTGKWIIYEQK